MQITLIKLLVAIGLVLFVLLLSVIIYIFFTGPELPDDTDMIIDNVLTSAIPEFVKGESGFVVSDNYKIWYESITPKIVNKGVILLFMGMAADALEWPPRFIDRLLNSGYQVIRFDYRGTGMSDWVENWKEKPYSLTDLAKDSEEILDALKIREAHLVGLSMGGMVAQEFAIKNTDRAQSLTIMMSSGDIEDKNLPKVSKRIAFDFLKVGIKYGIFRSEKNTIKLLISARMILRGDARYDIDVKGVAERVLYNLRQRNGYNPNVSSQHDDAAKRSRSRYGKLKDLKIPVLIIHGMNDPLVPIAHGKKLAAVIPGSKTKWFDNMGHDLPPYLIDQICSEILLNIKGD
jgi:pimeloyl-ACP methyl ester carboxylesterase